VALLTGDPEGGGFVLHRELIQTSPLRAATRLFSLGCYLSLTTPFVAGVLAFMFPSHRRPASFLYAMAPALALAGSSRYPWFLVVASGAAYVALAWVTLRLCKDWTGPALALALWSAMPLSTIFYLHMSAKYLVPSVPAYALLLVLIGRQGGPRTPWVYGALATAGTVLGLLIIGANARSANLARAAVDRWLPPLVARGERVLFQGQWGFQWYAEKDHAACFGPQVPDSARPGDWVIVGIGESGPFPQNLYPASRLAAVMADPNPGGIVLDRKRNVGFYSDYYGRLPWLWSASDTLRYELWQVQ